MCYGSVAHFLAPFIPIQAISGLTKTSSNTHTDPLTTLIHPTTTLSLSDPSTWSRAFTRASPPITTLYLVPPPGLPTFVADSKAFLTFAAANGVTRILWLSASLIPRGGPAHGEVHAHLHELALASANASANDGSTSGKAQLRYAVLRPTWFAQNFSDRGHFHNLSVRTESPGAVYSATGEGKVKWVDVGDIGAVAFYALTDPDGVSGQGREYLLLGPEAHSYDGIAAMLGSVLGREVVHVGMSVERLAERFIGFGVPEGYAGVLAGLDGAIAAGQEEREGEEGCVREVLGREPRGVREVFEEAKKQGAWD